MLYLGADISLNALTQRIQVLFITIIPPESWDFVGEFLDNIF